MPGFSNYVLTEAMPVMLKQPFKPDFDLSDAGTMQVSTYVWLFVWLCLKIIVLKINFQYVWLLLTTKNFVENHRFGL